MELNKKKLNQTCSSCGWETRRNPLSPHLVKHMYTPQLVSSLLTIGEMHIGNR